MRKLLLGALLLLSTLVFSQSKDEIIGWNKATWGMTENELIKSFPNSIKLNTPELVPHGNGLYVSVIIPSYKIENHEYKISFQMKPDTKKLNRILIELNETTFETIFNSMTNLLIEKYGEPKNRQNSESEKKILWIYPKTKITLTRITINSIKLDKLLIVYSQREDNESTKL